MGARDGNKWPKHAFAMLFDRVYLAESAENIHAKQTSRVT